MQTAQPDSWQHSPLSEPRQALPFAREFTAAEFALIQHGLIPVEMEDKWFIYYHQGVLHLHRSWTGNEIFQVSFDETATGEARTTQAWVTRDPEQYQDGDDAEDTAMLNFLIDRLLLNRDVDFPNPLGLPPEQIAVIRHSNVGPGRSNQQ
ncbi:hypothetical protein [Hymenobacter persicinus]|uniref:Uncharacterized protein n=1 Tax=Hymenobacter persicinus TaxID=2025506 RepID=A0A4Q5LCD4_9BACT|nr:hypothetical protein [Hymenobacter persicinus]RYU80503.1 hypothetical protein EWM57_08400 [Hymenobacter persicinus]